MKEKRDLKQKELDEIDAQIAQSKEKLTSEKTTIDNKMSEFNKKRTEYKKKLEDFKKNRDALESALESRLIKLDEL